jgi:hypothetical protein
MQKGSNQAVCTSAMTKLLAQPLLGKDCLVNHTRRCAAALEATHTLSLEEHDSFGTRAGLRLLG